MAISDTSVDISRFNFKDAKVGDVFDLSCMELFHYKADLLMQKNNLRTKGMDLRHILKGKVKEINRIYYQVVPK